MRKLMFFLMLVLFLACANNLLGDSPPWTGSSSYTFSDSDPYFRESYITNTASVEIIGGSFGILHAYENCTVNMTGGTALSGISAHDKSHLFISGGQIGTLHAQELSEINLTVESYEFSEDTYINFDGVLTGSWAYGGGNFEILIGDGAWSHVGITTIPEPSAILIFSIAMPFFRKQ